MDAFFEATLSSLAKRKVKPFVSLAAKQDRSFFNDARHRATLFDSGIISSMLDILSVAHKLPAIDATFTGAAESLPILEARRALLTAVREETEKARADVNARAKGKKGDYWAAGTGYGYNEDESYEDGFYDDDGNFNSRGGSLKKNEETARAQTKLLNDTDALLQVLIVAVEPVKASTDPLPESAFHVLAASCFVPVLRSLLRQSLDLSEQHKQLFVTIVRATRVLAVQPVLQPLLAHVKGDEDSQSLAHVLAEHASTLLSADEVTACDLASSVKAKLQSTVELVAPVVASEASSTSVTPTSAVVAASRASAEATYVAALKPHQFSSMSMETTSASGGPSGYRHKYASAVSSDKDASGSTRMTRIMRELRALKMSLPLCCGSSVFLRHDKKRPYIIQALISGPEDTPYDSGLFLFDVYCDPSYPSAPPKVNLMTTGGGSVRFNPNLYNCGKVCLSLLGTWSGANGENWTTDSTLLQVFVSIQALIFVKEPYFNEPGVERSMHSESSAKRSRMSGNGGYEPLRVSTLQFAVADMIRHPPLGFEEVVTKHFALRREHILETMAAWTTDATETKDTLATAVEDVTGLLASLPSLEPLATAKSSADAAGALPEDLPAMPTELKRADSG